MAHPPARLKVLSMVGAGRSGTTVLASILGEAEGIASAGELRWLWERGVRGGRPCACGRRAVDCEVWSRVLGRTLGASGASDDSPTVARIIAAQHEIARRRHLLRVLRSIDGTAPAWDPLSLVRSSMAAACSAFAEEAGARVVVDTSKRAVDAAVFAGMPDIDHYVLHVVRDPRAVVFSWRRAKTFTAEGRTLTMGTRSLPSSVRRWLANGLSAEAMRGRVPADRWLRLRYEDFASEPRASVGRILEFVGEAGPAPFIDDRTVSLRPSHIVAGNPSRFSTGAVTIRSDDEWRRAMSAPHRALVEVATFPLMLRYGYVPGVSRFTEVRG